MTNKIFFAFALSLFFSVMACGTSKPTEQKVLIKTNYGDITVKLYNQTPLHRDNFIKLVKSKFYDGVLFHRVIPDFMIQGGDPQSKNAKPDVRLGEGDTGYTIPAEIRTPEIFHKKGALAAARQGDDTNPTRASSGCQFYIVEGRVFDGKDLTMMEYSMKDKISSDFFQKLVEKNGNRIDNFGKTGEMDKLKMLKDSILKAVDDKMKADKSYIYTPQQREVYKTLGGTPHLDGSYTVFGEVMKGMEVVEAISKVKTNKFDRPVNDVKIISMKLIK